MTRGPKRWATADETALLESFWSEYITKQAENKLHLFWPLVREALHRLSPAARRLGLPDHNDPKERLLTQAELDTLATALEERNKRIKEWYRNKTKKIRNGAGYNTSTTSMVRKILKKTIDKRQRVHHGREVFAKRNADLVEAELDKAGYNDIRAGSSRRDDNSDDSSDDDSNDSAHADAGRQKKSKMMTLRGQVLGRLWSEASAEERVAVEAELNAEKEELKKPSTSTSEESKDVYETQKSIDSLDGAMGQILGSVRRETGWGIFVIAAGPNPSLGGELSMKIFCSGETPNGNDFERFCPNFTENIVQPFQDFTRVCFPPAVRHALAIPTVPLPTMTDDAPVDRLYPPAAPAEEIDPPRKPKRKSKKKKVTKSPAVVEDRDEAPVSAATALQQAAAMPPDPSAASVALGEHGLPPVMPAIPESGINTSTEQNVALPVEENEENVQSVLGNDFPFTPSAGWVPASGGSNSTDLFHGFDDHDANGGGNSGFEDSDTYAGADYTFAGGADPFSASPIAPLPPSLNNSAFDNSKTFDTTDYVFVGGVDPFPASPIAPRRPSVNEAPPKLWFPGQEGNAAEGSGSPYRRSLLFDAFRASPVPQTPTSKAQRAYSLSAISPQRTSSTTPASTFAAQVVLASIAEFTPAATLAHIPDKSPATVAPDFATHPAAPPAPTALTTPSSGAAATLVVPKPLTTKIAAAPSASTSIPPRPLPKPLPTTKAAPVPAAPAATAPTAPLPVPKPLATAAVAPVPAAPAPTPSAAPLALPESHQPTNPFTQTRPARKAVAAAKADQREDAANQAQQVAVAKRRGRPRKTVLTNVTNDVAAAANVVDPPASAPAAETQHLGDGYARGHINICHPPARNNTNRINAQKEAAATKRARENAEREAEREKREKERKQGFTERIVNGATVVTFIRTRTEARLPDGSKFQLQPKGSRDTSMKKTAETAARTGSKRKAAPATKAKKPAKKRAKA